MLHLCTGCASTCLKERLRLRRRFPWHVWSGPGSRDAGCLQKHLRICAETGPADLGDLGVQALAHLDAAMRHQDGAVCVDCMPERI